MQCALQALSAFIGLDRVQMLFGCTIDYTVARACTKE
jgi:hypothetical protein